MRPALEVPLACVRWVKAETACQTHRPSTLAQELGHADGSSLDGNVVRTLADDVTGHVDVVSLRRYFNQKRAGNVSPSVPTMIRAALTSSAGRRSKSAPVPTVLRELLVLARQGLGRNRLRPARVCRDDPPRPSAADAAKSRIRTQADHLAGATLRAVHQPQLSAQRHTLGQPLQVVGRTGGHLSAGLPALH